MTNSKFIGMGKYIVILWLLPMFFLPGLNFINELVPEGSPWYNYDLAYYYYYHFLCLILLGVIFYTKRIKPNSILGTFEKRELISGFKLTLFVLIFSVATAYLLFYPLSSYFPEIVKFWYIEAPPIIYSSSGEYPAIPNILSFASLCIFAPVIEELAFRGVLLHSWECKWGLNKAIIFSSVLFGLLHPDPIGATAFGIAMCILYLRTQSLFLPIVCHSANNFLAWCIEAGYFFEYGSDYHYTLEEFRSDWLYGVMMGLVVIIWGYVYLNGKHDSRVWKLPDV